MLGKEVASFYGNVIPKKFWEFNAGFSKSEGIDIEIYTKAFMRSFENVLPRPATSHTKSLEINGAEMKLKSGDLHSRRRSSRIENEIP